MNVYSTVPHEGSPVHYCDSDPDPETGFVQGKWWSDDGTCVKNCGFHVSRCTLMPDTKLFWEAVIARMIRKDQQQTERMSHEQEEGQEKTDDGTLEVRRLR